jgi:ribokinase
MITVFGSINVDVLMQVERLPRPGETVLSPGYLLLPGGKGANQACAAARAGAAVAMFGCVGEDEWAGLATRELAAAGVDTRGVARVRGPTGCAAVWSERGGENSIVAAIAANAALSASQVPDEKLEPGALLLLQMEAPAAENWSLVARAHERGTRIVLNAAPAAPVPDAVLDRLDLLVVNAIEAVAVARQAGFGEDGDAPGVARRLADRHGLTCIVTLGRAGAIAAAPERDWTIGALPITAVDTTGAGDAFVGALAAALDAGEALPDALRRASVGAALACLSAGCQTAFADADAIAARLADLPPAH